MGEGWGEGEKASNSISYIPLPFIHSRKGRGNVTFYEFVNLEPLNLEPRTLILDDS